MTEIERCPACHGVIAVIGRTHLCRPRATSPVPPQVPRPKLSGGAAVKVRSLARPEVRSEGAKVTESSRGGVEGHASMAAGVGDRVPNCDPRRTVLLQGKTVAPVPPSATAAGVKPGPRETKPRAAKGTATYAHRDADKHRAYQRDLMKKRRAKEPA